MTAVIDGQVQDLIQRLERVYASESSKSEGFVRQGSHRRALIHGSRGDGIETAIEIVREWERALLREHPETVTNKHRRPQ